jgi:membrane protein required for beta-lactamase induction
MSGTSDPFRLSRFPRVLSALPAIERLLLSLWVGGLWVTGAVFAPALFTYYLRPVAADIAGRLFSAMSLVGLACGSLLVVLAVLRVRSGVWRDWRAGLLAVMLVVTAIGEFGIAARMRVMRQAMVHHSSSAEYREEFTRLHGTANTLYILTGILGAVLVVAGARTRDVRN